MSRNLRLVRFSGLALLAAVSLGAHADWLDTVTRALGISKTPSAMRGPDDPTLSGDIYLIAVDGSAPRRLTSEGGYRSPVFAAGDAAILALKGQSLVSVPLDAGTPREFRVPSGLLKLLGVDRQDADRLMLLTESAKGTSGLAELSLRSGRLTPMAIDGGDRNQRRMLSHLVGQNRDYEGVSIRVRTESRAGVGGPIQWSDVYVQRGQERAINVSRCDGTDCAQPALSADLKYLVFIRAMKRP